MANKDKFLWKAGDIEPVPEEEARELVAREIERLKLQRKLKDSEIERRESNDGREPGGDEG